MTNHNSILEVNLKNLQYNYKKLSGLANRSICAATIKSDAYGLGVLMCLMHIKSVQTFFCENTKSARIKKKMKLIFMC